MSATQKLLVSIIVLAHNDKKYLEGCLSSLLDQDLPQQQYEIIYADNASTDGSIEFVRERFPEVRIVALERNFGFAEGNNRAADQAIGRYIIFQNADTIAHRRWLPELMTAVQSNPQVKAAHPAGAPLNFGGYNERHQPVERGVMCELTRFGYVDFTEMRLQESDPVPTLFIAGGSLVIDAELGPDLKYYFDPSYFIYNEDTDLGLRINNLGHTILFVPTAVAYHQRDPSRRVKLSQRSVRMAFLVTRNRFVTFYKNMFWGEFLLTLPLIFLGSIIKLRTMPLSFFKGLLYVLGLMPLTLYALGLALLRFPQYRQERQYILGRRVHGRYWLFKALWRRAVPPPTSLKG
ncbi:MAG: glycosyltransferase family 2 protein [Anaerolineales bacterium]|nr:glycosyltransferase family 2 protein [Anaerolineales bacterium]